MIKVVNLIGPLCKELSDVEGHLPTILVDGALKWRSYFKNSLSVEVIASSGLMLKVLLKCFWLVLKRFWLALKC